MKRFSLQELIIGRMDVFYSTSLPKISPKKHYLMMITMLKMSSFKLIYKKLKIKAFRRKEGAIEARRHYLFVVN